MHISLDLADDVRDKLQKLAAERGITLNNLTNDMVRLGLEKDEAMRRSLKPCRQTGHGMGGASDEAGQAAVRCSGTGGSSNPPQDGAAREARGKTMSSVPLELEVASIVVEHLDELAADRGISRDSLIERVFRLALDETDRIRREYKPFRQKAYDMGAKMDLEKAMAVADDLYDQELIRKMKED